MKVINIGGILIADPYSDSNKNDAYKTPYPSQRRVTTAFCRCRQPLSSDIDERCPRCGWLICSACQSCGCDI